MRLSGERAGYDATQAWRGALATRVPTGRPMLRYRRPEYPKPLVANSSQLRAGQASGAPFMHQSSSRLLILVTVIRFWRAGSIELFDRNRDGFLLGFGDDGPEALGAVTDQINGPAGHGSPPHCPSDHVENRHDDDGGSDGDECIEENAMSSS